MGFFALSSAFLLLLIPPLVLLYFLKLKRPRLDVPSLVLWRQVLNDNRVNSPFQKFKRHILLWLQLLLLCLLILAAMQPFFRGGADRAHNVPVLIDHSASMAALDASGGASRLDAAKQQVAELINNLQPDQRLCLIAFAGSARKLTGFENNQRLLHDALDKIVVEDVPSDIEDALRITEALAQRAPFDEVLMYSDGNFEAQADFALPFQLQFQKLDPAGANAGIVSLSAKRGGGARWDVFVGLAGSSEQPQRGTVTVLLDGQSIGSEFVSISRDSPERIMFPVEVDARTEVEVRFAPEGFDSLAVDDRAYLTLDPARQLDVYLPKHLHSYRIGIEPLPGVGVTDDPAAAIDLFITDQKADLANNAAPVSLLIGIVPDDLEPLLTRGGDGAVVVDWKRNDVLLSHVNWTNLSILDSIIANEDVRETDYENLGYEVLVHGRDGPLLVRKREGDRVGFHMLFHSDRSILPYRVGFPVLLQNLARIAMHRAGLLEARGDPTGVLPAQTGMVPEQTYRVDPPAGPGRDAEADPYGILSGVPAPRVGYYRITGGGEQRRVPVSLLDPAETQLAGVDQIRFNEMTVTAAAAGDVEVDRPLWRTLAILALIVLLVEWWFFQRRPGGYARAAT